RAARARGHLAESRGDPRATRGRPRRARGRDDQPSDLRARGGRDAAALTRRLPERTGSLRSRARRGVPRPHRLPRRRQGDLPMTVTTATATATALPARRNLLALYLTEVRLEFLKLLRMPMYSISVIVFPVMLYFLFGSIYGSGEA